MKTIVNSWNEWDPLKHIILGRADGCCIPPSEPAVDGKVPEDSDMRGQYGVRPKETIDKANELVAKRDKDIIAAINSFFMFSLLIIINLRQYLLLILIFQWENFFYLPY